MPRKLSSQDGRRSIEVLVPIPLVDAIDRLRYDHPYRSRSGVVVDAIEHYLRSRGELPEKPQ